MNKKILKILSVALAAAIAISVSACSTHEHDISKWVTVTEATCITPGIEEGICATCGETVERETGLDANNHEYGDWQITTMPTEDNMGTAKKICSGCGNELMVPLPVLSSNQYTTSITTRPTATTNGVRSYSFYNENGNIEFTTEISSTGITSVMDAVEVSCDDVSHANIRSGKGTVYNGILEGASVTSSSTYSYSYEYGDNYTHIDNSAADSQERWYGVDSNGDVYGYCLDTSSGSKFYEETKTGSSAVKNYIYGYRYVFVWATFVGTYYGTENFVLGLYNSAKQNANGDFKESVTVNSDNETEYYFSYGVYTVNGTSGGYFSNVEVTFTLTDIYTIKTCTANCTTYVNASDDSTTWKINDDGYAYIVAPTGMRYVDTYTVTQKTVYEDTTVPVNPYNADSMRVTDYDIVYNSDIDSQGDYVESSDVVIDDDTLITITARQATQTSYSYTDIQYDYDDNGNPIDPEYVTVTGTRNHFYLTNITPDTAVDNVDDDIAFYYRKYNSNGSSTDYEINYSTAGDSSSSIGVACTFDSSTNSFVITSKLSGYVDIVVKTHNTEKIIHLYVEPIAPSTLYPMIYEYSTNGYSWSSSYTTSVESSVYVGQNLYFKTEVPDTEVRFADEEYTVSVTRAVDSSGSLVTSDYYSIEEVTFNGQTMSAFSAQKAGTYVLSLVSVRDSSVVSTIYVTVNSVPDRSQLFSGTYSAKLSYTPKGNVKVTFEASETEGVYYATIEAQNGIEVLKCTYNGITLKSEHYSGADNSFTLTLNEAYDLVISHSTGYQDDLGADIMETLILTKTD